MKLQSSLNEKLSTEDFDPTVIQLNELVEKARVKYEEARSVATENWSSLQHGAMQALEELDSELQNAAERIGDRDSA